jgi:NAD(P)-dependent dehydrogenase (short-subunit alcohol dehydrogenase family)
MVQGAVSIETVDISHAEIFTRQALKRMIRPDEIASLVLFLAAEDSSSISSTVAGSERPGIPRAQSVYEV